MALILQIVILIGVIVCLYFLIQIYNNKIAFHDGGIEREVIYVDKNPLYKRTKSVRKAGD